MLQRLLKTLQVLVLIPLCGMGAAAADVYLALEAAGEGTYAIDARFWTPGDPAGTWSVLTDYDHLHFFIPSLRESQIQQRTPDFFLVKQEAVGHALGIFHRHLHVLLKVREKPNQEISFEDTALQDFVSYGGYWQIESAAGGGSWVKYHLSAQPKFFAPAFVARKAFKASAKELLLSVQVEILRRSNLNKTLLCCSPQ